MPDKNYEVGRPILVKGMGYAPTSEQGVVYLFGRLAPRLGFHVERVQVRFPDCLARRRGKLLRIEFEQWASHFAAHRHDAKGADVIVCWENDWESRPARYRHLEIIDLKKYVGATPRVFVVGCRDRENAKFLDSGRFVEWNIPATAQIDDLVVMYRAGKAGSEIKDLWKIVGPFTHYGPRNRQDRWPGLQAGLRLVARLREPISYSELAADSATRELGVVKKRFLGKTDVTDDWHLLYKKIVSKNPSARKPLSDYMPD